MFTGHPKGLYTLALANTGERFGYYTMLAIFTLFLQAKFGYTASETSTIFASFLALVYFMPLLGGIIADKWLGYGKTATIGIIVMFAGYLLLAVPTGREDVLAKIFMFSSLFLISTGTGLFKGNLQVMVGNLYEDSKLQGMRDTAFSIFYMAINIGALFAPTAATKVTNFFLAKHGLVYNSSIPSLSHQLLDLDASGNNSITADGLSKLEAFMHANSSCGITEVGAFAENYIDKLSTAYNYGFAIACLSLIISMIIYVVGKKTYKHADYNAKQLAESNAKNGIKAPAELTKKQTKERVVALMLVFAVVLFFWMAFHQNGLTMTFFARDYTEHVATGINRMSFDVFNLVIIVIAVYSLISMLQSKKNKSKIISGAIFAAAAIGLYFKYTYFTEGSVKILPQIFQQFNPFFVVALTPISLAIFGALAKKGKEPSAPRKIGMGMVIAACGFIVLAIGSYGLPTPNEVMDMGGLNSSQLVSSNWLISTYLILTFAELLLSPMGISFVSKVAPPKLKGAMMGGWFAATALGNYLVAIIGHLWGDLPLWQVWSVLIVCCLLSAVFIFSVIKRLDRITKDA
ncbi:MAG: peptide MFS transporter [Bacteroidetes bacterium]|nr:peptide MFS transporter [Bacteroidota bacterium]